MSATTTPNDSPAGTPIQPMHNPAQAANVPTNQAPGMGAKALLAKKFAKSHNPTYISPTDNMMTPVTQKLNAAKKKHFNKPTNGVSLFSPAQTNNESSGASDDEDEEPPKTSATTTAPNTATPITMQVDDEENPF
ncbi:hypothetical protein D9619_000304 [Psilocybe cf. subviscida]|uniref:Spo12-like protein n=1 Tax=Psilocybe cf. subviscida TaxID=2480587 RepID=A0A8H5F304_9AGAR|nr:hypothetical protein D9619_000304 [Psilocybe cf. subviscida]